MSGARQQGSSVGVAGGRGFALGTVGVVALLAAFAAFVLAPAGASAQGGSCANAGLRTGASEGLPDCRALELVSPSEKVGGTGVGVWYAGPSSVGFAGYAAYEGERFAVRGDWGSVLTNGAIAFANDWALAERTAAGWVSKPAATRGGYGSQDYRFIGLTAASDDLGTTTWNSNTGILSLFPELEFWNQGRAGNPTFVRGWTEDRWDLFGTTAVPLNELQNTFAGISAPAVSGDGRYAVGGGTVRGLGGEGDPTHPSWPDYVARRGNVYLFDLSDGFTDAFPAPNDDRRVLVNSCKSGTEIPLRSADGELGIQACPVAGPGRPPLISPRGASLNRERANRAISHDGSRVFFVSPSARVDLGEFPAVLPPAECTGVGGATTCPPQLYVRQRNTDGGVVTRWVSRPRSAPAGDGSFGGGPIAGQDASLLGKAIFEGASRDGSRVFFRTASPLTPDDPNAGCGAPCLAGTPSKDSWDLYMYELPSGADGDPGDGTLTRISGGAGGNGDCNSPFPPNDATGGSDTEHGGARFVSDGGERVYFVCAAPIGDPGDPWNAIASGALDGPTGTPATATSTNLYVFDAARPAAERWAFVARLPRATTGIDACASMSTIPGALLQGGLTKVDLVPSGNHRDCVRGTADGMFITFMSLGQLTADDLDAAADLYGYDAAAHELVRISRPAGGASGGAYVCGSGQCNADTGIGPQSTDFRDPLSMLNVASDPVDGGDPVVFFQSRSKLVGEDVDDAYDIYRWRDGELALVSRWASDTDGAFYVGNDVTGRNVYVATRDRLTWEDRDAVLDIYTARVGGGIPEPDPPPAPCDPVGGSCRGGGGAPPLGLPPVVSDEAAGAGRGDVSPRARARLVLGRPSAKARRRAARRGVLAVRVRRSRAGVVRVVARSRIGGRVRRVAARRVRVRGAGVVTVRLRLNRPARRRLRSGRALRVVLRAVSPGARARTATVRLKRGRRS